MTTALNAYVFGNCTYYVATRFPQIYAYLGNAADWITNAKKQNYSILNTPAPDTVVVYGPGNGYSSLGHVAVVDSVNNDGSFNVSEMNYRGFDLIDQRRSTMKGVLGFIVPPGSSYKPPPTTQIAPSSPCLRVTHVPGLFPGANGFDICWDGAIGMGTMLAGGVLILGGVAVFTAFALKSTGLGNKIGEVAPLVGGPFGAALSLAQRTSAAKPKPTETQPSQVEQKQASDKRMATAKARVLSPGTQSEVDASKRGEGKKLSPGAREELAA